MTFKIALVTEELAVYGKSGGIGAAIYEMAIMLAENGHRVDILYIPNENFDDARRRRAVDAFADRGVKLEFIDPSKYVWNTGDVANRSYSVYRYIKEAKKNYHFIHFHDYKGLGFFSCSAKRQGIAFADTTLVVQLHGPTRWALHANRALFTHSNQILIDYLEREAIRLADHVVSPSNYLIEWLRENGFKLPADERVHMIKNVCSQSVRIHRNRHATGERTKIRQLIFFGRHEARKGIVTFCDALDLIEPVLAETGTSVCFLGGLGEVNGWSSGVFLSERSRKWGFPIEARIDLDRLEALAFLASRPATLVVIPSSAENSPYTVVETLAAGRAVLTSRSGGGKELIHSDYHRDAVVDAEPEAIAERLKRLLREGALVPQFAETPEDISAQWLEFHSTYQPVEGVAGPFTAKPKVVVGITHFERPRKVIGAVMSVLRQTYENIELVVVDDGSRSNETKEAIPHLKQLVERTGGRFIQRENGYLGAARNTIVKETTSDYVIFLDDDDLLLPGAVEKLVEVAGHTDADIVNCLNLYLEASDRSKFELAPESLKTKVSYVPTGGPISLSHLANHFGAATALIKRSFFDKIGGYTEIKRVGYEDYEFYLRAAQQGGNLTIVPEPLYLYEVGKPSMISSTSRLVNKQRVTNAIDVAPHAAEWIDALELAAGIEAISDEQNMAHWLTSSSPHAALLTRVASTRNSLPDHVEALREYAIAISAPSAALAWEQALCKPEANSESMIERRARPVAGTFAHWVARHDTGEISTTTELVTLWALRRFDDASAELANFLERTGEANEFAIEFAHTLASSPELKASQAASLSDALSSITTTEDLALKLQGALTALDIAAGRLEAARTSLAFISATEAKEYVERYKDLQDAFGSRASEHGLKHYQGYGFLEGREGFEVLRRLAVAVGTRNGREIRPWQLRTDFDRLVGEK
ncbi:glycosyltransferase [Ensifer sp. 22521]|uniref:glycosyltransferase n=1 Tax=Ensifer sp. 22521 TaxID=3453935 RepID=UPI003F85A62B